jgi:uncharacterized integral membrane protein (TIGR00697 family)
MMELSQNATKKILVALSLYLTSLFAANTLGLKIMPFLFDSHLSVAVFSFPIVFLMTDVIGELYGRQVAKLFVRAGFISTAMFMGYALLSLWLPWSSEGLWAREGYNQMFGLSLRMGLASLVAFAVAEFQDVFAFFYVREKLGTKYFWLRSLISNLWSQLLDSVLFMVIAFAGVYSTKTLVTIIITWWLYKVLMGVFYTPLSYLALRLFREKQNAN